MRRWLILGVIVVAAVVGVAIAVASNGSSGGAGSSTGATVSVQKIDGAGSVLVDSNGKTLYRSEQEKNGMVLCDGACLSFWQPLTVTGSPKGQGLSGKLAVVKRPDGGRQVTYNGKLLYSFKLDSPGELKGDNFKDAFGGQQFRWHAVRTAGAGSAGPTKSTPTPTYTVPSY